MKEKDLSFSDNVSDLQQFEYLYIFIAMLRLHFEKLTFKSMNRPVLRNITVIVLLLFPFLKTKQEGEEVMLDWSSANTTVHIL